MPLNAQLYHRIRQQFGHVEIANQGEPLGVSGTRVLGNRRVGSNIVNPGEYYRVNCPFCHDTRRRLWINHSYGKIDPVNGQPLAHLAICYNDDCLYDEANRNLLRDMLLGLRNRGARTINWGNSSGGVVPTGGLREMPWPGSVTEIWRLFDSHPAILYLNDRGFAKSQLAQYGIMFCTQADGRYCWRVPGLSPPSDARHSGWLAGSLCW